MIIKFFMGESYNAMSCDHYHVVELNQGSFEVTLYPTYKSTDGVTYRVCSDKSETNIPNFDSCVIIGGNGNIHDLIG